MLAWLRSMKVFKHFFKTVFYYLKLHVYLYNPGVCNQGLSYLSIVALWLKTNKVFNFKQ